MPCSISLIPLLEVGAREANSDIPVQSNWYDWPCSNSDFKKLTLVVLSVFTCFMGMR